MSKEVNAERTYVDIHVIQTVPPSCVNRDDTNSPKTAIYGGTTRARVSSQAWKKSTRDAFKEKGFRTKRIMDLLVKTMRDKDSKISEKDAVEKAMNVLKIAKLTVNEKDEFKTSTLFFASPFQIDALAELALEGSADRTEILDALKKAPTIDLALFGRMVAEEPYLNIDASCQVAHAISTHKVDTEFDFFTAIDNCAPSYTAQSAMLGTTEFNSSTLYRYATIAAHDLKNQIGGSKETAEAVKEFISSFLTSMPTGKQASFANRTLPDHVMVTIRSDQPVNMVGAFEKAVRGNDGYVEESIERLEDYAKKVYENYCGEPTHSYVVGKGLNMNALVEKVGEDIENDLAD